MKKIIIILVLLIISVGCVDKQNNLKDKNIQDEPNKEIIDNKNEEINNKKEEPINIYLFWGDGCHVCANIEKFFNELDDDYNQYFNLIKYQVWGNKENQELMMKIGEEINETYYAVPYLVIGDEVIVGFNEEKKEYILDRIIEEYNNDRYDVMKIIKK